MKLGNVTIQMKATEQYFAAVLSLYKQWFLILDLEDIIQLKPNNFFDLVHSGIKRSKYA